MQKLSDKNQAAASCADNPIQCLVDMWTQMLQWSINSGQCPAQRTGFQKPHGIVGGKFKILPNLPEHLRVGIFAGTEYPAWVRFSSDTTTGSNDYKTILGAGIKLFDVPGTKIFGQPGATTFDFALQNSDVFFVNNALEMCNFTQAAMSGGLNNFFESNPASKKIFDEMNSKPVASVLTTDYWSGVAFAFGPDHYVKYKLEPYFKPQPLKQQPADPGYLAADLAARLQVGEAGFRFMLQFQTHPETMPLDAAMVPWSEKASTPVHVADLILFQQDMNARGHAAYGENLSLNIWRVTEPHTPQGSLALARREVYSASAKLRRDMNGVPTGEPDHAKPYAETAPVADRVIVRAAIHPGIGIARIGDSTEEYFVGPQTITPDLQPANYYRDPGYALKRQAAEFRIYGYNAAGKVVSELTADNAYIQWTAHLANKKASWYRFIVPMDIPQAIKVNAPLRNPEVQDRASLIIDPGPRTISGKCMSGADYHFDSGTFQGIPVPLGELRTDNAGHLLVLGGRGNSGSPNGTPVFNPADTESFANADGWYDDISDGPVSAQVSINGKVIPVEPAWVVVGPPNYAPNVLAWRTAYDLLTDNYTRAGVLPVPEQVSFTQDVLPLLARLTNLQWVNRGFAAMFGSGAPMDFNSPDLLKKLSATPNPTSHDDPYKALRFAILNSFRLGLTELNQPQAWPWLFGNAYEVTTARHPGAGYYPMSSIGLSMLNFEQMQKWANGDFINDWSADAASPKTISQVPLADQPAMLDRAALEYCAAGAFLPGVEMPWIIGTDMIYSSPYRFRQAEQDTAGPLPPTLDIRETYALRGPLHHGFRPGDVTRWMAVPWQTDTAFCRSGYSPNFNLYTPAFWPARVPNQVLTESDYKIVVDTTQPMEVRMSAFQRRSSWFRSLTPTGPGGDPISQETLQMVAGFSAMGLITPMPGVPGEDIFPDPIFVESLDPDKLKELEAQANLYGDAPHSNLQLAGWRSQEELEAARAIHARNL